MSQREHEEELKASGIPAAVLPMEAPEKSERVPLFRVGELLPWKGVEFQVEHLDKDGMYLKAVRFTKKGIKR